MRKMARIVVLLAALPTSAFAVDYHVNSAFGFDRNAGTALSPWKTITHALAQPLIAGDRVFIMGYFDRSNGESFPLRPPQGVSILGGFAAIIDAGGEPAFEFDAPAIHDGEFRGLQIPLTIIGHPAFRARPGSNACRVLPRIGNCIIDGNLEFSVEQSRWSGPAYPDDGFHPLIEECTIDGHLVFRSDMNANGTQENYLNATVRRNTIRGGLFIANAEHRAPAELTIEDNDITGPVEVTESEEAGTFSVVGNTIRQGGLAIASLRPTGYATGEVRDNGMDFELRATLPSHQLLRVENNVVGLGMTLSAGDVYVLSNQAQGRIAITASPDDPSNAVDDNVGEALTIRATRRSGYCEVRRNHLRGGGLDIVSDAMFQITRNVIEDAPTHGLSIDCTGSSSSPALVIQSNTIQGRVGSLNAMTLAGRGSTFEIDQNTLSGFARGLLATTQLTFSGGTSAHRVSGNVIHHNTFALSLDLSALNGDLQVLANTVARNGTGVMLPRNGYPGMVEFVNNIFADQTAPLTGVRPGDRATNNLVLDASLRNFDVSNLSGIAHFVDPDNGVFDLLQTSPCIETGIDLSGSTQPTDMGAIQSGRTRNLFTIGTVALNSVFLIRTTGTSGGAYFIGTVAPARTRVPLPYGGLLGFDLPAWFMQLPGPLTAGRFDLPVVTGNDPALLGATFVAQSLTNITPTGDAEATNTLFMQF
ncbi:MAG: right-handed parallel beta-helix repeat-containing protein [Planctomycetes bacterium]|nr:right-handed parallel beta-helix repeat-containing protein [Planctomycetota bacterium]